MERFTTHQRQRLATIIVAAFTLAGCSKSDPGEDNAASNSMSAPGIEDDAKLRFLSPDDSGGDTNGGPVMNLCRMVGPHNSLIVAEIAAAPTYHRRPPEAECDQMKYQDPYFNLPLDVVATAVPPAPASSRTDFVIFGDDTYGEFYDHSVHQAQVGDRILASVRESNGTWFIDEWTYVNVGTNNSVDSFPADSQTEVDMPSTWGELVSEASAVKSDHAAACPNTALRTWMDLDENEYADRRYPPPYDCSGVEINSGTNGSTGGNSDTNNGT
jgi:hypothetical protein